MSLEKALQLIVKRKIKALAKATADRQTARHQWQSSTRLYLTLHA